MKTEMKSEIDVDSPPLTSEANMNSGPTDIVEPEAKVPRIGLALPVVPVDNVKSEEGASDIAPVTPDDDESRASRMKSDSSSSGTRSSARARRARAQLEAERARAEYAAARIKVAEAELAVIEAEESEEERAKIEESEVPTPRMPEPSPVAPAVVLPVPLNMPTIYHHIGDPPGNDEAKQEDDVFFDDCDDVKEAEAVERERIDAEYERLNRAQQVWAQERALQEQQASRQEAERVAQLHHEARMLQARLGHEADYARQELLQARSAEELRLQQAQVRISHEAEAKAMEFEKIRDEEVRRLREEQERMRAELEAAKQQLSSEAMIVHQMRLGAEKAMDRAKETLRQAEAVKAASCSRDLTPSQPAETVSRSPEFPPGLHFKTLDTKRATSATRMRTSGSSTVTITATKSRTKEEQPMPSTSPPQDDPPAEPKEEKPDDDEDKGGDQNYDKPSNATPGGGPEDPGDGDDSSSSNGWDHGGDDPVPDPVPEPPRVPQQPLTYKVKVKSEQIKLSAWPTTLQFPAWRRALRSAVAGACDQPLLATKWLFEVERAGVTLDHFEPDQKDPFRALDAKLADALGRITKGEPARKIGLHAERAALKGNLLTGRQHLLLIYAEFKKDEEEVDHAAYSNFEALKFDGKDDGLEQFLNLWDGLMITFRTPPTEPHMYSALYRRLKHCPGLRTTIDYLDRQPAGHVDKTYDFLMSTARRFVERRRAERQASEYSKIYRGGGVQDQQVALPGLTNETPKGGGKGKGKGTKPCFQLRDTGSCPAGASCSYSHDPQIIAKSKSEKLERAKAKAKGKGKKKQCSFFNTAAGCKKGASCEFLHEKPTTAVPAVTPPAAPAPGKGAKAQQ